MKKKKKKEEGEFSDYNVYLYYSYLGISVTIRRGGGYIQNREFCLYRTSGRVGTIPT